MYKNYLLALLSGLILAFAWPTYGCVLLLFVGFVPLLWVEYQIRISHNKYKNFHTFLTAYFAFFIWNLITTWWIWNSTKVGGVFAILVNALLMTLVFYLYHLIAKRKPQRFALLFFVAAWIAFEKFHHNWDFSWPWLTLGNAFSEHTEWIQWYEFTGTFGGSLWVLSVNVIFFTALVQYHKRKRRKVFVKQLIFAMSWTVLGIFLSLYKYHRYTENGDVARVLLLQPNTDPYSEKYFQSDEKIATDLIHLMQEKIDDNVSFVLAPETVFSNTTTLDRFYQSKGFLKLNSFLQDYPKITFLGGLSEYKIYPETQAKSPTANTFTNSKTAWYESYNTAFFLSNNQKPEIYHKMKLVVGVEHFPFRSILQPLLGDVMINLGGSIATLTPDKAVKVFQHPNTKVSIAPVICYESIYGEFMGDYVKKGAGFFGIISNDSWWGNTQGHKQLLSYARLHAVSHRRAIARSANSGISALINQRGDILSSLAYGTKGSLKGDIQVNTERSFYSQYGDYIARIASFVSVLFLLLGLFVKKRI